MKQFTPKDLGVGASPEVSPEGPVEFTSMAQGVSREVRRLAVLLALALAAIALLHATPVGALIDNVQNLRDFLEGDDLWAEVAYVTGVAALVAVGTPRLIFYGLGGIAFGFWEGLLLAQIGALSGSLITFRVVRWGGRDWVRLRLGRRRLFQTILSIPSSVTAVALIRQLPLSSFIINAGLAVSRVRTGAFLAGSFVGFLPQGIIATLIGSGLADDQVMEAAGQLLAAGFIVMGGAFLLWRWRKGNPATQRC